MKSSAMWLLPTLLAVYLAGCVPTADGPPKPAENGQSDLATPAPEGARPDDRTLARQAIELL